MEFKQLLDELDALELPPDQFAITFSGPLAVRGLRRAEDIDIVVSPELWKNVAEYYLATPHPPSHKIKVGNIEILGPESPFGDTDISSVVEQIASADVIDGRRYVNLHILKKLKDHLGREKDKQDIKLIDDYLSTH